MPQGPTRAGRVREPQGEAVVHPSTDAATGARSHVAGNSGRRCISQEDCVGGILKFFGSVIGIIFLIGLIVVVGLLMLIF
jgi:hypothetical protein